MPYTIGDFATALGGLVDTLDGIASELNECDPTAEIDNTPGWRAICSIPVIVADTCVAPEKPVFTVADLVETIAGLRGWIGDVQSRLANFDPLTQLDSGSWPVPDVTAD